MPILLLPHQFLTFFRDWTLREFLWETRALWKYYLREIQIWSHLHLWKLKLRREKSDLVKVMQALSGVKSQRSQHRDRATKVPCS